MKFKVEIELQFEVDLAQYKGTDPVMLEQEALGCLGLSKYVSDVMDAEAVVGRATKYVLITRMDL